MQNKRGADRFLKLIVAEAARSIWKLRCHWKITEGKNPEEIPTEVEAKNRTRKAVTRITNLDCLTTDSAQSGKKAMDVKMVQKTWQGILPRRIDSLKTWSMSNEVLVSIG